MRLTNDRKTWGFEQSRDNPHMFRNFVAGKTKAILVVHMDELLALTVTKEEAIATFVGELRSTFKIKDLGEASYYMSCHITRNRAKKELKFDQNLEARTITDRFGIDKTAMVPVMEGVKPLSKEHCPKKPQEKEEMTKIPYRKAVGALMWTSTMIRPDISSAACTVANICENSGMAHWKTVVKIIQYGRRTLERGITYGGDWNGRTIMLRAWTQGGRLQVGRYVLAVALSAGFRGPRRSPRREVRRQSTWPCQRSWRRYYFSVRYKPLSYLPSRVTPSTSWRTTKGPSRWPPIGIRPSERRTST